VRVLFIVSTFLPSTSGEALRSYSLCSGLLKRGHPVAVLTFRHQESWQGTESIEGLEVVRVNTYGESVAGFLLQTMAVFLKMATLLASGKYDVMHVRGIPHVYGACLLSVFFRVPVVFEVFSTVFETRAAPNGDIPDSGWLRRRTWRIINRVFLWRASRILLICRSLRKYALERGCPGHRMSLLPNGADMTQFTPRDRDSSILREYDLQGRKVVLYLGKFQVWEGLPGLVEAFQRVKEEIPEARLLLVGDGPDRAGIERAVQAHGLADHVVMTGFVPFEETPRYYSVADVCVIARPKLRKTEYVSPLKPVEAMAMGKVVVSTDLAAMREIIEDGKTGLLTEHSVEGLSRTIIEVLRDDALRERIGTQARAYVENERNWEAIVKTLADTYDAVFRTA